MEDLLFGCCLALLTATFLLFYCFSVSNVLIQLTFVIEKLLAAVSITSTTC